MATDDELLVSCPGQTMKSMRASDYFCYYLEYYYYIIIYNINKPNKQ